jgi:hypothetical protein
MAQRTYPAVCTIKITGGEDGGLAGIRSKLIAACAAEDAALIIDIRDADPSYIQHVVALVTLVRENEGQLRSLCGIAIVVTHDWARSALRCALSMVPEITKYIVTDKVEEAGVFCARAIHERSFPPSPRSSGRKRKRGLLGVGGRETKGPLVGSRGGDSN